MLTTNSGLMSMAEDNFRAPEGGQWYVLHVRPRCEKKTARCCMLAGAVCYLPLRLEARTYQRRRVEARKPLFPGYVFAAFRPDQRAEVLRSGSVANVLPVADQEGFVREIAQVSRALAAEPDLRSCRAVRNGMRVRIVGGPFQGLEGVVEKTQGRSRVTLNVDMIGLGVAIEVDENILECL